MTVPHVLVAERKNIFGLATPDGPASGLNAEGNPAEALLVPVPVDELFDEAVEVRTDHHIVAYLVLDKNRQPIDPQCRLKKEALQAIRDLGHDVVCQTLWIDLDLGHVDDLKEHYGKEVGWKDLPDEVAEQLEERFNVHPKIGNWRHLYKTEHGCRYVFVLDREVPCGSNYEALVNTIIESFWEAGLPADRACIDWTRMYRAPRVTKEGGMSTWEQRWFDTMTTEGAVLHVPEEFMVARDERRAGGVMRSQADRPDDDEAEAMLFDHENKKTDFAKSLDKNLQGGGIWRYVFGSTRFARDGDRHKKLTQVVGALVDTIRRIPGATVEHVYAAAWQCVKLLDQDEDWRSKAWEMARSFWARDGGAIAEPEPDSTPTVPATPASPQMLPAQFAEDLQPEVAERILQGLGDEADKLLPDEDGEFDVDNDGVPKSKPLNCRIAIKLLDAVVEYDEFSSRFRLHHRSGDDKKWRGFPLDLNDHSTNALQIAASEELGVDISPNDWRLWTQNNALRRRRHPVREYLASLKWDGVQRVERWLPTYMGAEDSPYTRAVGTLFLVAAVRRIRDPGCKFDEMMLLEGVQGSQKSGALRILAVRDEWFTDDLPLGANSKETMEQTQGKWIAEAADLQGMSKRNIDDLKAFLSRREDTARMAYGHFAETCKRQFIIAGTTNSDSYLQDATGNRRFLPVKTNTIDMDGLLRDRDQIWAEAALYEDEGMSIRLDPALYPVAAAQQEERMVDDPWLSAVQSALSSLEHIPNCWVPVNDLWAIVGVKDVKERPRLGRAFGNVRTALKMARAKIQIDGEDVHYWIKGDKKAPQYLVVRRGRNWKRMVKRGNQWVEEKVA